MKYQITLNVLLTKIKRPANVYISVKYSVSDTDFTWTSILCVYYGILKRYIFIRNDRVPSNNQLVTLITSLVCLEIVICITGYIYKMFVCVCLCVGNRKVNYFKIWATLNVFVMYFLYFIMLIVKQLVSLRPVLFRFILKSVLLHILLIIDTLLYLGKCNTNN